MDNRASFLLQPHLQHFLDIGLNLQQLLIYNKPED